MSDNDKIVIPVEILDDEEQTTEAGSEKDS